MRKSKRQLCALLNRQSHTSCSARRRTGWLEWCSAQLTSGVAGARRLLDSAATGDNEQSCFYVNRGHYASRGCANQTGQCQPPQRGTFRAQMTFVFPFQLRSLAVTYKGCAGVVVHDRPFTGELSHDQFHCQAVDNEHIPS